MDIVRGCEEEHGNDEHGQQSYPECNPERDDHEPEIHRISRDGERAADHQRRVAFGGRIDFRALGPEQQEGPGGQRRAECDECNAQPDDTEVEQRAPGEERTQQACDREIDERPDGRRNLEQSRLEARGSGTCRGQNPFTYGRRPAVASIAAPASSNTLVESHVPLTS